MIRGYFVMKPSAVSSPFMIEPDAAIDALLGRLPFAFAPTKGPDDFVLALTPSGNGDLADYLAETAIDVMSLLDQVGAILLLLFFSLFLLTYKCSVVFLK